MAFGKMTKMVNRGHGGKIDFIGVFKVVSASRMTVSMLRGGMQQHIRVSICHHNPENENVYTGDKITSCPLPAKFWSQRMTDTTSA